MLSLYICKTRKCVAKTTYTQVPLIYYEGEGNEKWIRRKSVIKSERGYQNMRQSAMKERRNRIKEDSGVSVKQDTLY